MLKLTDTMAQVIVGLSLLAVSGLLVVAILYAWDWAFTKVLEMLHLKLEFIQFIYDKYHKRRPVKQKME